MDLSAMHHGAIQAQETARLAGLAEYAILDTPAEKGFDDIVSLASTLCDTPVALVSLIEKDRQWFKARIGFEPGETPISQSICAHGLRESGLLIIPDLTKDPRTRTNTLVTSAPFIRFYAGARLETPAGIALGMVCVIDTVPRPAGLTERQGVALQALARQVMAQMELRRLAAERDLLVKEAHHRVKNSLQMVQALLSLQARTTPHIEAAQQLRENAARVHTVAAMHAHLYRVGAARDLDLGAYLKELVTSQRESLVSAIEGRGIHFDADASVWPSSDAPTIGLVLIELVTNALKYGSGLITVTLCTSAGELRLTVDDEGTGLPPDFNPAHSPGFGMRVLLGLLESRGGKLRIDRSKAHTSFVAALTPSGE